MSINNWKDIWAKRGSCTTEFGTLNLETLIQIDGYDTGSARIQACDWKTYVKFIADKLMLKDGQSLFEVGCGAGAFLYELSQSRKLQLYGLDYSDSLINIASQAVPNGTFTVAEALALETSPQVDFVIANSVFHYFNMDYATNVIHKMLGKARVAVAILDIPDNLTRKQCEETRQAALSPEEYAKKYENLGHQYFDRAWFVAQAEKNDFNCEIFGSPIMNYQQAHFRFCAVLRNNAPDYKS